MSNAIHLSTARKMLDNGDKLSLKVVKKNGEVITLDDAVSLKYDFYKGTRTVKLLRSHRLVMIRDVMIIGVNEMEVFL